MKRAIIVISSITLLGALAGCGKSTTDKDGVPLIQSASAPVVNGTKMTPKQFFDKYCTAPNLALNATCNSVKLQAMRF